VSGTIAIGNTITLDETVHDFSGAERPAGSKLVIEQVAHETTRHPIILATPAEWERHAVTHRTLLQVLIGGEYCFYLDDLREATDGVPF
jgi:hypothetical protein